MTEANDFTGLQSLVLLEIFKECHTNGFFLPKMLNIEGMTSNNVYRYLTKLLELEYITKEKVGFFITPKGRKWGLKLHVFYKED